MGQQQDITTTPLMKEIEDKLPRINFYRFCQLLEQVTNMEMKMGIGESPTFDPIRFAPSADMSFPSSELKCIEREPYLARPITVRTRFLGLYGVDSALPSILLDDIVKQKDGYQAMMDFLDIFNHRIITQFYRIWLKYHYPASFITGGKDPISQCLIGLTGLGVKGASGQIGTPPSRFLALLGLVTQKTRTAEGIIGVIKVLVPHCDVSVDEFYPVWVPISKPATLCDKSTRLGENAVLGKRFLECNQCIKVKIKPRDSSLIELLLPGGQLYQDVMTLLRAYLGYQVDVQLYLYIQAHLLPKTRLVKKGSRLGQTSVLLNSVHVLKQDIAVSLGRYRGLAA